MYIYFRIVIKIIKNIIFLIYSPINILKYIFFFPKNINNALKLADKLNENNLFSLSIKTLKQFEQTKNFEQRALINFKIGDILFHKYKKINPDEYFNNFFKYKSSNEFDYSELKYYPPKIFNSKMNNHLNIIDKIYDLRKKYPTNSYSDNKQINIYKYYQSEHNLHMLDQFKEIKKNLEDEINRNILKSIIKNPNGRFYINKMWFVISSKGISLEEHNHPEGVFSGILYLKVPPSGDPGELIIKDPKRNIKIVNLGHDHEIKSQNNRIILKPKLNNLVLFNSYVKHSVKNQSSEEDRISLPFDLIYSH